MRDWNNSLQLRLSVRVDNQSLNTSCRKGSDKDPHFNAELPAPWCESLLHCIVNLVTIGNSF